LAEKQINKVKSYTRYVITVNLSVIFVSFVSKRYSQLSNANTLATKIYRIVKIKLIKKTAPESAIFKREASIHIFSGNRMCYC